MPLPFASAQFPLSAPVIIPTFPFKLPELTYRGSQSRLGSSWDSCPGSRSSWIFASATSGAIHSLGATPRPSRSNSAIVAVLVWPESTFGPRLPRGSLGLLLAVFITLQEPASLERGSLLTAACARRLRPVALNLGRFRGAALPASGQQGREIEIAVRFKCGRRGSRAFRSRCVARLESRDGSAGAAAVRAAQDRDDEIARSHWKSPISCCF